MTNMEKISFAIRYCKNVADNFSEAYSLIENDAKIVKIPNQRVCDVIYHRKDGNISVLADLVANFRTVDRQPVGKLATLNGTTVVPRFWPLTGKITKVWGYPNEQLLVDAYILSPKLCKRIEDITTLPQYQEWT